MKIISIQENGVFRLFENAQQLEFGALQFFENLKTPITTYLPTTLRCIFQYLDSLYFGSIGVDNNFIDTLTSIFGPKTEERIVNGSFATSIGGAEQYVEIEESYILNFNTFCREVYARSMTKNGIVYLESSKLECLLDLPLAILYKSILEDVPQDKTTMVYSNITLYDFLDCIFNKIAVGQ